jgi:hypothetical protein
VPQVVFYDASGRQLQAFDYSTDEAARDFSCCAINPSNDTAVVGAFNRLYVFSLNNSTGIWQHMAVKQVSRFCLFAALQLGHLTHPESSQRWQQAHASLTQP